mgnify:FL=1
MIIKYLTNLFTIFCYMGNAERVDAPVALSVAIIIEKTYWYRY